MEYNPIIIRKNINWGEREEVNEDIFPTISYIGIDEVVVEFLMNNKIGLFYGDKFQTIEIGELKKNLIIMEL